jgi:outer membrane protein assembly factor BamA
MRKRLVEAERWRAAVDLEETYDPARGRMRIAFRAEPGPRTRLEVRGSELPARLLARLRQVVREGAGTADSLEAGAELVETRLRALGHRDASARAALETLEAEEVIAFEVQAGPEASVASVELRGADPALLQGLRTQPGRALEDAALGEDARLVTARLEALGHFEARVEPDVPDGGGALAVVFDARPGPRATVADVQVSSPPRTWRAAARRWCRRGAAPGTSTRACAAR